MENWRTVLQNSITTYAELRKHFGCDIIAITDVIARYPLRINPYYLQLISGPGDPLWRQAVPDPAELTDSVCLTDPLAEEQLSPVPNLVHKYPDRALLLVSGQCAMYCRFCTRKRKVGTPAMAISPPQLEKAYQYISDNPTIRDVLVSGGDPLLLADEELEAILTRLRAIPSVETIRIGSRIPATLPMRVTKALARLLQQFHPLYLNTHFNHPRELTAEAARACALLADHGIPLGNQTVLLRGVNNDLATLKSLFTGLLRIRVKPYYLFQADLCQGTNHFRTPVEEGIVLMQGLYGHLSGMAIPTFALDAPGGKGKIPLTPQFVKQFGNNLVFENYRGELCNYPNDHEIV